MSTRRLHTGLLAIAMAVVPLCVAGQMREWSLSRGLVWGDFQGTPDSASKAAALTAYEIQARSTCEVDGPVFRVTVKFLPTQSWIKPKHRTAQTLAHEQGHFDLAEVTARRLRAELGLLDQGCADGTAAFTKLVADFQERDAEQQRSYDRQTMFGTASGAQRHWEARIKSWLREKTP